ncbi:MAG: hypothetical protein ACXVQY_08160 [Actinomycetota bacterium]
MSDRDHGSPGTFFKIWRESDQPFLTKVGLVVKNNFIKIRTLKDCCGNYGEPGC